MKTVVSCFAVGLTLGAASAAAQTGGGYAVDWHTIDAGGGVSRGGGYDLAATIGQSDTDRASGDTYELIGGFWLPAPGGAVPARPMPDDAFDIDGTVRTCTTDADCLVGISATSEVYCVQPPVGETGDGVCYVRRNRYLSIRPNADNGGLLTARRVRLSTGEMLGWVGPPVPIYVNGPEPVLQQRCRILSAAHYMDWSTVGTVHVGDCAVAPQYVYEIQAILSGEDEGNETNYSEPLILSTVLNVSGNGGFGDVVGASPEQPPDGYRNFKDINAVINGFQAQQKVPKSWLDLQGPTTSPLCPDFGGGGIDFNDIGYAVWGFQGGDYLTGTGFPAPLDCPPDSCP